MTCMSVMRFMLCYLPFDWYDGDNAGQIGLSKGQIARTIVP